MCILHVWKCIWPGCFSLVLCNRICDKLYINYCIFLCENTVLNSFAVIILALFSYLLLYFVNINALYKWYSYFLNVIAFLYLFSCSFIENKYIKVQRHCVGRDLLSVNWIFFFLIPICSTIMQCIVCMFQFLSLYAVVILFILEYFYAVNCNIVVTVLKYFSKISNIWRSF
jgi:hypothetical protein